MTKTKTLNTRIPKNVSWQPDKFAAIKKLAIKMDVPFNYAANLIVGEWMRTNPEGTIKIGGNDHEATN